MLKKTNRLTLVEQVALQIEELIESGRWPIGFRIPAEPELMAELNVSRNTLREAIRALTHAGLLRTRQGDGTYVASSSALGAVLHRRIGREHLLRTLEVRHALEREAATLAALRRSEEDVATLRGHMRACEQAAGREDREAFIAADIELHFAVAAAARNELLQELYAHVADAMRDSITGIVRPSGSCWHQEAHSELVEAIAEQSPERAALAVGRYIEQAKQEIDLD
ncbi:FadR/GntR family transcriptional regulator [Paenibacillus ginsengarvi]|uniref:FadR family transcriptional regulator n=1 Tax=Paenibacillus ginsengarvi TaxID=400777 RepID=A0A3B0CIA3_9BACL|nr:FadR/GntR family transcriptional regulator [Paenibacillus ginsengarvi]RKN84007.1 FadR family transcriptional regulator [Paenibacillus ginsengarvi]